MNQIQDFDVFAERYEEILGEHLNFFDKEHDYFSRYKAKLVKKFMQATPGKILEYGCGIGRNLKFLKQEFPIAEIHACDISRKSLEIVAINNSSVRCHLIGVDDINQKFDLIFMALVLHHVESTSRTNLLGKVYELLSEGGNLFVFEHNPYNPITRYLVNTCDFDHGVALLKRKELENLLTASGFTICMGRYTLYFPAFLKGLRFLESGLGYVPLGGQYFIKASKS